MRENGLGESRSTQAVSDATTRTDGKKSRKGTKERAIRWQVIEGSAPMTQASRATPRRGKAGPSPYVPKRKGARPKIDRDKQRVVSAYLSTPERPTLWEDLMSYLEEHDLTQTEWMRWIAAKCVDEGMVPPKEE